MGAPQKMTLDVGFCRGGPRCGWKGISIAFVIHSVDRTYVWVEIYYRTGIFIALRILCSVS